MVIRNCFKHALKSIFSQGRQSVISAIGLSIALTCSILIILYVQYEFSFDAYHENADHIYRIVTRRPGNMYMGKDKFAVTQGPLKEALLNDIPEVKYSTKCKLGFQTLEYNSNLFAESGFLYADTDFLKIFSFPVISGNPSQALKDPFTLFVTRDMALKYFGNKDPVGKTIRVNNKYTFTVSGVLENVPQNSHFHFDFLTGFETLYIMEGGREKSENWNNSRYTTYIQLEDNVKPKDIKDKLNGVATKYLSANSFFKGTLFIAEPLKSIHLGSNSNFEIGNNSDIKYIFLVSSMGLLIILIACFNYMNIATARSYNRGRETGILKVSGAGRGEIIIQLITESVLLSFGGLILAFAFAGFLLPPFSAFTERPLTYTMIFEYPTLLKVIALTLATGIFAGTYPALHLSSISPLNLITENYKTFGGSRSGRLRNLLVVVQNIISVVALICAFTVMRQLHYIETEDIGFEKENIIIMELRDPLIRRNPGELINELKGYPAIVDIATSLNLPGSTTDASFGYWEGKPEETEQLIFRAGIDDNFLDFYGIKIIAGRGFSNDFPSDTINKFVINETAAKIIGLNDPVGRKFGFGNNNGSGYIIGIIDDYHFQSLHLDIEPLALSPLGCNEYKEPGYISVKVNPGTISETMLFVNKTLKELSPHYLNPVSVFSDRVDNMYRSERKLATIFIFSAILAVILTCLGQYSLSSYTTKSRTKEMVIRKVMGSQAIGIMALVATQMIKLILLSLFIAWPVAYLLMTRWLQNFAYHINIGAGVFLLSLVIVFLISLIAVSYHVVKLSRINPAEMIRHD